MKGHVKHIVLIQSLQNERLTGTELYEDCIRRRIDFQGLDFTHVFYNVDTKDKLIELLRHYGNIANYYENGLVLHLEMHGDKELKGLVLSNGQLISWLELVDLFRVINIGTCNNLYITMATCNGREIYTAADPHQKSPYAAYISASMTVDNSQIAEAFFRLFDNLLDSGNLITAYLNMERIGSNFYYKDSKTTFEEGFYDTMQRLYGDENLKAEIVADASKAAQKATGFKASAEFENMVFETALKDIFKKHYDAFQF